jgi:hypothetical protein
MVKPEWLNAATPGTSCSGREEAAMSDILATIPVPAEPPEDQPLEGRLTLRHLLGSGATGDVHLAHDRLLDRMVAVKLLHPHAAAAARQRFDTEAHALAKLSHPALVPIFNIGTLRDRPCLVMHFVDGGSLATRLREGPLPLATTLDIGVTLADALAHTHEHGVVHRDVTPSNILLDTDLNPHLTGFGTALLADDVLDGPASSGALVGPEVDVHGLGQVLLACLTGTVTDQPEPGIAPPVVAGLLAEMTAPEPGLRPTAARCHRTLLAQRTHFFGDPEAEQVTPVIPAPAEAVPQATVEEAVPSALAVLGFTDDTVAPGSSTVPVATPAPRGRRSRARRPVIVGTTATTLAAGVAAVLLALPHPTSQPSPTVGQHAAGSSPAASAPAHPVPVNYRPAQSHRTVPGTLADARVDSDPGTPPTSAPAATTPQVTSETTQPVTTTTDQTPTTTTTVPTTTEVTTTTVPTTTATSPSTPAAGADTDQSSP